MTKTKFVFNIDGKKVTKTPAEAIEILQNDRKEISDICDSHVRDLAKGIELLAVIDSLIEEAEKSIKEPASKKEAKPTAKKRGRPAKVVAPAPKKRGRPAKVNTIKQIKKSIKKSVKTTKKGK